MHAKCQIMKPIGTVFNVFCLIGVLLSIYALMVEIKKEHDADYEAMCDLSEHISCSKALTSSWGRGFGVLGKIVGDDSILNQPNSLAGILFYILLAFLNRSSQLNIVRLQLGLSIISNLVSIYLASILTFILKDFCVVCVSTYVVNAVLLILSIRKFKLLASGVAKKGQ